MDKAALGRAIRDARQLQGLSLRELEERSGISFSYIQQIETAKATANVTLAALEAIAVALSLNLDIRLGEAPDALAADEQALVTALRTLPDGPRAELGTLIRGFSALDIRARRILLAALEP